MGFLKKTVGALLGTGTPKYNQDKSALTQQYGVQSDLGNVNLVKNSDGTYSKQYTSSAADQARNNLISQGLGALTLDPTQTQQAYYDQATRLLNDQFDRQRTSADTNLINRGIQVGTKQYSDTMGDLINNQNGTLQDIANQAVYMGQQDLGQRIGNINSLSSGRDIYALPSMGGSNNAYDNSYEAKQYQYNTRANAMNNLVNAGASLAGLFAMSDRKLKENLHKVGALANGLNVYIGNYKKETGLDTTPQLFLIAQEVQKKHPEAVKRQFGALAVDYKKAVK